ncbi:MAG: L-lactate dehydrogenase [Clostridia bacterium]|nr:L-lactate dehydrogenase [Clostridia bacterium]
MGKKITVIGAGSVGATIAYTLSVKGIADEIVMIDINENKVLGEALDIRQGLPFCRATSVYAGGYAEAVNSDIVVITSGLPRKPGQTRLELAQANVDILKSIMPRITKYAPDAIYILVANPVDILTYTFVKYSGIPENHIFGSGTMLDSVRLRSRLAEYYGIDSTYINAYMLGEHGDSMFLPWSLVKINGNGVRLHEEVKAREGGLLPEIDKDAIEKYVRTSGGRVIARKGATFYAVSMSVAHMCECVLNNVGCVLPVSVMMNGEHGVSDVCLSYPTMINSDGVFAKVPTPLTEEEEAALRSSGDALKAVISGLAF